MKKLAFLFLVCCSQLFSAQEYVQIDAIVKLYPSKFKSIESFAKRIDSDFETDIDKTRAAYFWIANHISYDYEMFQKRGTVYKGIKYDNEIEYQEKQLKQEFKYAEQCLRKNKAICEGYSQLLRFTLKELNVPCEIVSGSTKTSYRDIGRVRKSSDHAWNAVKIDNQWKLIDATWSTGNTAASPKTFNFNEAYFLTDPKLFILDHFPEKQKWQLLEKPMNRIDFFLLPKIYYSFFKSNIKLGNASVGLIKVKANDTIKLAFKKVEIDKFYKYAFKNKSSTSFLFEDINNEFIVKIPHSFKRSTSLIIYFEDKSILEYKIIAEK